MRSKITRLFVYTWFGEAPRRALRRRPGEPGRLAAPRVQRVQEERGQAPLARRRRPERPTLRRSARGPLPDDRGPGGRQLGGLARARQGLRGARRPGAVPLRPLPQPRRRARPRLARRVGDDQRARRASRARCGSARSSPPPRSATRPSWPRSSPPPTTCPAGASSSASAPAGTSAEHRAYGFPFPPMRERMDMLAEQLEIVHGSWTDGAVLVLRRALHGSRTSTRSRGRCRRPHPPLIMGGSAGPRSAALAARWADEYNTPFASLEDDRERKAAIDAACETAGREPIPFSLMTGLPGRPRPRGAARARGRARRAATDADEFLASPPDDVDRRDRRRGGRAARRAARRRRRTA